LKSLIRNICIYKLTKVLKLDTLSILSKTGEFIYVLVNADEELIKDWAEKTEYQLQIEMGLSDPMSLEPCDYKWRPLRLSKSRTKPNNIYEKEKELELLFYRIYKKESDNLHQLNPNEHADEASCIWQAYEYYLDFLNFNKIQILKILDNNLEFNGIILEGIFDLALEYSYKKSNLKLNTMWNYFKIKPIGAYSGYFRKDDLNLPDEVYRKLLNNYF